MVSPTAVATGLSAAGSLLGGLGGKSRPRNAGRAEEFAITGNTLFDVMFDRRKGPDALEINMDPRLAAIQQGLLDEAGGTVGGDLARSLGEGLLGELQTFNPIDIAQHQFGLLAPILNEQFDRDRLALEGRQFAQGRLGSTGGAQDFGEMLSRQNDARTKLLFDSFNQGLLAQGQMFDIGSRALALDPTLRSGALANILDINAAALRPAQVGGAIAGAGTGSVVNTAGGNPLSALGAGLLDAGLGGFERILMDSIDNGSANMFAGGTPFANFSENSGTLFGFDF